MSTLSVPLLQGDFAQQVLELPISTEIYQGIRKNNSQINGAAESRASASLPVPNPTKSFWIDTPGANPLAKEGSEGILTSDADVCIIGSGITGVSAAYHLAELWKAKVSRRRGQQGIRHEE